MKRLFARLPDASDAMSHKLAETTTIIRRTANDPDMIEGDLRHALREAARLIDHLGEGYAVSLRYQVRAGRRYAVLTGLFLGMAALNVLTFFFK